MTQKTITIQDLSKILESMDEDVKPIENDQPIKKVESTVTMSRPSDVPVSKQQKKESKYVKPIHITKIGVLLLCAILLQSLFNTKYVKAYSLRLISNPLLAKAATVALFAAIIGTLFVFTIRS
jgi:hypothetical protein